MGFDARRVRSNGYRKSKRINDTKNTRYYGALGYKIILVYKPASTLWEQAYKLLIVTTFKAENLTSSHARKYLLFTWFYVSKVMFL
ncbi:hypothetical protein GCM10008924_00720 [Gracilibacillus halotolerans]